MGLEKGAKYFKVDVYIHIYTDDLETMIMILRVRGLEVGHRTNTRTAAQRPEIQEHIFPAIVCQCRDVPSSVPNAKSASANPESNGGK